MRKDTVFDPESGKRQTYCVQQGIDGEIILTVDRDPWHGPREPVSDASSTIGPGCYEYENGGRLYKLACDRAREICDEARRQPSHA